jgi:hypothetical protein
MCETGILIAENVLNEVPDLQEICILCFVSVYFYD